MSLRWVAPLMLLLLVFLAPTVSSELRDVTIYVAADKENIEALEPFSVLITVVNPTTWTIENLTLSFKVSPPDIRVVKAENTTNVQWHVKETVEYINVTAKVLRICPNTSYSFSILVEAKKAGTVTLEFSVAKFVKVKGEYEVEATLTVPNLELKVAEQKKAPPKEGKLGNPIILSVLMIAMPVLAAFWAPKLSASGKQE